jgi:hypothetical protein
MGIKGDWKRRTDPAHTPDYIVNQIDAGQLGCKRGNHFYIEWKQCRYCGKVFIPPVENGKDAQ